MVTEMAFQISGTSTLSARSITSEYDRKICGMASIDEEHISGDDPPRSPKENWPLRLETNAHRRNKSSLNMLTTNDMGIRKWEGKARRSTEWDDLRRVCVAGLVSSQE